MRLIIQKPSDRPASHGRRSGLVVWNRHVNVGSCRVSAKFVLRSRASQHPEKAAAIHPSSSYPQSLVALGAVFHGKRPSRIAVDYALNGISNLHTAEPSRAIGCNARARMISGQQSTMAGMAEAYRTPDGALHLPLLHHASGELMGWQTRMPGKSPRYSTGVKSREAAPFIAQRPTSPEFAIITEGPTDAIAASQCAKIGNNVAVYGCWSSSTIPPKEWWEKNLLGTTVIVAGDGDAAGRVFNQRVADMVGAVYVARIPDGEDVRSLIETRGEDLFMATLMNALIRPAIKRSKSRKPVVKRQEFATLAGIDIISLVESAGGKRKSKLSTGGYKYLCPLHDDRNDPSLTVDPAAGSWYCWAGCGGGGPAQFVMAWRRCDYRDAVRWLESVHA